MKKITGLIFAAAFLFSHNSFANNTFVEIENFKLWSGVYGSDVVRIEVPAGISNPDNCPDTDSYMVNSTLSDSVKEKIYSTLLAATLSKTKITIVLNGCQDGRPGINTTIIE